MIAWVFAVHGAEAVAQGNLGLAKECVETTVPASYDEDVQQAFLMNTVALSTTFSPLHGPSPRPAGTGGVDIRLAYLPALSCEERAAQAGRKTEDANKSPIMPLLTANYAFRGPLPWLVPYLGMSWIALPVEYRGTRIQAFGAEVGLGLRLPIGPKRGKRSLGYEHWLGIRGHSSTSWVTGEIALPISDGAKAYNDVYVGTTSGAGLSYGLANEQASLLRWEVYVAGGVLDTTTFFWVGDDSVVGDNAWPYLGPDFELGGTLLFGGKLRLGAEAFIAPGGARAMFPSAEVPAYGAAGHLYTFKVSIGFQPDGKLQIHPKSPKKQGAP